MIGLVKKELKIRIDDYRVVERRLLKLGAQFIKESIYEYTYFNQPKGKVLKTTKNDDGIFLSRLERENDNFNILPSEPIKNGDIQKFEAQFGVKKRLVNKRSFFSYKEKLISTNQIQSIGQFLIIEDEEPKLGLAIELTGNQNPEVITESFDDL